MKQMQNRNVPLLRERKGKLERCLKLGDYLAYWLCALGMPISWLLQLLLLSHCCQFAQTVYVLKIFCLIRECPVNICQLSPTPTLSYILCMQSQPEGDFCLRIDSFFRRRKRFGYIHYSIIMSDFVASCGYGLFCKLCLPECSHSCTVCYYTAC